MASRTVHTCDRCGEDFTRSPGSVAEVRKSGTVCLVAGKPGEPFGEIFPENRKDLCQGCSDGYRAFMAGVVLLDGNTWWSR